MKILIADFDLFHNVGGGQIIYRRLIEINPTLEFYYLIEKEAKESFRPPNAHAIKFRKIYHNNDFSNIFYQTNLEFIKAFNIAASVAGLQFDIVEFPDYVVYGLFLRAALKHHRVGFEKFVLSLHGRVSTTISLNWSSYQNKAEAVYLYELMQYHSVDIRYGISQSYIEEMRTITGIEAYYLNPLSVIKRPTPVLAPFSGDPPGLLFIGRGEKRKGPDIFQELVWWLPKSSFKSAKIIGPENFNYLGIGSSNYLSLMAKNRNELIEILPTKTQEELFLLFSNRNVTMLPSRYDTLNLLAIESLLSGCPTAIGNGAGACRFLQETFPDLPFITINTNNIYSSLPEIKSVLDNYDLYREKLYQAILNSEPVISNLNLKDIYAKPNKNDLPVQNKIDQWFNKLMSIRDRTKKSFIKKITSVFNLSDNAANIFQSQIPTEKLDLTTEQIKKAYVFRDTFNRTSGDPEGTEKQIERKIQNFKLMSGNFLTNRVKIWKEISRLEKLRGNDLLSAFYKLRNIRSQGKDLFNDLPGIINTLNKNGYIYEAEACQAMFGNDEKNDVRCSEIIQKSLTKNKQNKQYNDYEIIDDKRLSNTYRVSIIVSLYNTASKLPYFLNVLQNQNFIKTNEAEVILVETGSPGNDYLAFKHCLPSLKMPVVYARTVQRETIQNAWNRGVALSRSPYLTFLGVDEMIVPDCLNILAEELDKDPALDWVEGNSVVTKVDRHGSWEEDVMLYDRRDYFQNLVYLETCYLSWVGALYRRSIHDRFGYYDPTFKAAGDTEFKNRVLPFLKTKAIPKTLGIFWNYPEARTTQGPVAEFEDMRAWYLYRTLAGVKHLFSGRNHTEAENFFYTCLNYRKSYCEHMSTDIELADVVIQFLAENIKNSPALKCRPGIKNALTAFRNLDLLPEQSFLSAMSSVSDLSCIILKMAKKHGPLKSGLKPSYNIFQDNRYEQHSFQW